MECNWINDLPCLSSDKQDFYQRARGTSFLTSAENFDHEFINESIDFNDFAETRESLGIFNAELVDDVRFEKMEPDIDYQLSEEISDMEDYTNAIKPEDMLVPLSELQPETFGVTTPGLENSIKSEDMLVSLSTTEPKYDPTPQGLGVTTLSTASTPSGNQFLANSNFSKSSSTDQPVLIVTESLLNTSVVSPVSSIPKIIVRVNKIPATSLKPSQASQIHFNKQEVRPRLLKNQTPTFSENVLPVNDYSMAYEPPLTNSGYVSNEVVPVDQEQIYPQNNADILLDELVEISNNEPNVLSNLISSFSSSMVQAGMDELLNQLESCDSPEKSSQAITQKLDPDYLKKEDISLSSRVASPEELKEDIPPSPNVASPVPSMGNLSPNSISDRSFHHQSLLYSIDETTLSQAVSSVLSPAESSTLSLDMEDNFSLASDSDNESGMTIINRVADLEKSIHVNKGKSSRKKSGARPLETRKERKKEQNKQAAIRYRQKKKKEDEEFLSIIKAEEERQQKLKQRYKDLKQELQCMKKIMREVLIAKGTLPPSTFRKPVI